jgi:hypothetical protein
MKNLTLTNGTEINLSCANAIGAGAGHKKITVELYFNGNYKDFSYTTTDMSAYDEATELDGEDKQIALFEIISHKIEDLIFDWIYEIDGIIR